MPTFPLSLPPSPGIRNITTTLRNNVAITTSPFSFGQQVYDWGARRWEFEAETAPMPIGKLAAWRAWMNNLAGPLGTFRMGPGVDADRVAEGGHLADFAVDNWGWAGAEATTEDGQSIGGQADALKVTATSANAGHSTFLSEATQSALTYTFSGEVYLPSTSALDGVRVRLGSGIVTQDITDRDAWIPFSITGTAGASPASVDAQHIVSGSPVFAGSASHVFYLRAARVAMPEALFIPRVNGGSQDGNSLVTDGWHPRTRAFNAGSYFGVGGRLYQISDDINADSAGVANLSITPQLRASPADDEPLVLTRPTTICRLSETSGYTIGASRLAAISIRAVESL